MIWLDICDDQGNALYFDMHHVERRRVGRRWQYAVSGICGNGLFEVSVLVEPNEEGEVTYIDLSAGSSCGRQLLSRLDSTQLEYELLDIAHQQCDSGVSGGKEQPHWFRASAPTVCEENPLWSRPV
ncbi:MAG: hypothetical protein C0623_00975 [Desulfuromonas sp.]|nr:MAG: hypothetical protein C0623_00975 [Desulfuromonas sp.]